MTPPDVKTVSRDELSCNERVLPHEGLTLHELGELIRRLGRLNGFRVHSEHKSVGGTKLAIDWVWKNDDDEVVAGFEIEGRNVDASWAKDQKKLVALPGDRCLRVIALFQVNHDGTQKGKRENAVAHVQERLDAESKIRVFLDTDLLDKERQRELVRIARGEVQ